MSKKLLVLFLLIFLICGCKSENSFKDGFAIVYQNNTPYLLNRNKELFDLSEYDYLSDTFGEYIVVGNYKRKVMKYGYIDNSGNVAIKPQYDQAYPFSEGRAVVCKDNQYFIINSDNKKLFELPNGYASYSTFKNGYLILEKDGKYTFLNSNYQICPVLFDSVENFSNGYALVINNVNNKLNYNFLNEQYQTIFTNELENYDFVDSFYDGYARVGRYINDTYFYSYINPNGQFLTDEFGYKDFLIAENFSNNHALCYNGVYSNKLGRKYQYSPRFLDNTGKYYNYSEFYSTYLSYSDTNDSCGPEILSEFYFEAIAKTFVNNYLVVKHLDEGAGYSALYKLTEYAGSDGKSFYDLDKVKLIYKSDELSQFELSQYSSPYDMRLPIISKYYLPGTETLLTIARIYNDKFAIIDEFGNYIFEAIYDNIIM